MIFPIDNAMMTENTETNIDFPYNNLPNNIMEIVIV
ncbi:hypothetical protein J2Z64_003999 [Oceanobacillus polygoni]|uniref:Uncharacterized protein n=1 Tax=Oceanobacillus polygoni TaxID=1235259 RepID=A0A9X0Z0B6_9BACI|nr:hypothetical protein [Oceanobacillus polygoni]